jgi:riboflavin synthase
VFTGIVEELGEVVGIDRGDDSARLRVRGPLVTGDATQGDSIAINGVCLTVTAASDGEFSADVMGETLSRSSLGLLTPGAAVNLERPLRPDGRLGGHIVQGHVDATGIVLARQPSGGWEVVRISVPPDLARYLVEKGSVAVDGISLTISALGDSASDHGASDHGASDHGASDHGASDHGASEHWFEVSLIPETLARTTLGRRQPGEVVNLEVDMIAKYVERLLAGRLQ